MDVLWQDTRNQNNAGEFIKEVEQNRGNCRERKDTKLNKNDQKQNNKCFSQCSPWFNLFVLFGQASHSYS